jgi:TRAP-type uncharacterized transport system fused permease subunit
MALDVSAFRAVFWATVLAVALSFRHRARRSGRAACSPRCGGRARALSIAATTASAGIIVGVVTLTGLGLKLAGLIVALAGASLASTVVYAALAVWVLGLAVPVTASYIIAAVMIAPALVQVGVPGVAAHMFIFYYAVLQRGEPAHRAVAVRRRGAHGGNAFRTMLLTWKYTLPAFLVPVRVHAPEKLDPPRRAPACCSAPALPVRAPHVA